MNKALNENPYIHLFIKYSLPLLVIGIISRTFPIFNFFYYLVPVILLINILLALSFNLHKQFSLKIILIIFLYPLYCLITSLWSLYPDITLQRSVYQILLYSGTISAVLLYKNFLPDKGIVFLLPANISIVLISLFSLLTNIPDNSWTGGHGLGFMGFAGHQNTLASALLFTLPGLLAYKIKNKGTKINVIRIFYFLLLTFDFLLLLLTYSRASILALIIGTITYLLITKSIKILSLLFSIFALIFVLYFIVPPLQNSINTLISKDGGSILGRRMILWEPSLEAAKSGGVIGLGYGVSAPNIKAPVLTGSHYENGRYIREKGNSVLAIIEETGLIGLLLFLLPLFYIASKLFKSLSQLLTTHYSLLTAALAAMLIHAQFEAWMVGVGSVQFPLYLLILFLTISIRVDTSLKNKI